MKSAAGWVRRAVLTASLVLAGCLSPTLPLPPPDSPNISAVNDEGFVTLQGLPGGAEPEALVVALNQRTGNGVIERADKLGQYTIVIAAQVGDTLTLWQVVGVDQSDIRQIIIKDPSP